MRTRLALACVVMLTVAATGCDNDPEPVDAGSDAGSDAGMMMMDDAGVDAGEPPVESFRFRLAHNIPGLVGVTDNVGSMHICLWQSDSGVVQPGWMLHATGSSGPIPFRGISTYIEFLVIDPLDYLVGMYDAADFSGSCPADPYDSAATPAVLLAELTPDLVPADSIGTAVASGLAPDTLGATGGALPSICNPAAAAPTFAELCTAGTELFLYEDDETAPATGMTRFRVMNQVVNSTPPSGWTLCYDPGLVPNTPPATGCIDVTPSGDDQEALASAVAYGDVTDYEDRAPIVPTGVPAAGVGGGLYLHLEDGSGCPAFTDGDACYPIFTAWPDPTAFPDEVRPMLEDGAINTIFISGLLPPGAGFEADFGISFFVWQDN